MASQAGGGPDWRRGGRARAERTKNMYCMSVTLDVSQLSGWLNAYADCRVQEEAWKEGDMRAGRWEGAAGRWRRRRWRGKQRAGEVQTGDGGGAWARSAPGTCSTWL